MMKRTAAILLCLAVAMISLTGCGNILSGASSLAGSAATGNSTEKSDGTAGKAVKELDPKVMGEMQDTIGQYFRKLYSAPIDSYAAGNATGTIPEAVKGFVAERTLKEGGQNPEIWIHFPRYVGINGLTAVTYKLEKPADEERDGDSQVEVSYLGDRDDTYMFFAKVNLIAGCVPDSTFNSCYRRNPATKVYDKVPNTNVTGAGTENIRLQARYDIKVVEEDGNCRILSAVEASRKADAGDRLFVLNNEFVNRMPYLNTGRTPDGKGYINKADGEAYEKESVVIKELFENMKALDDQRMSLLRQRWSKGAKEFGDFLVMTEVSKNKDSKELMNIGGDFRNRFDIDSFPLQPGMEKLLALKNITVVPFISYSSKQKVYSVKFDASVRKLNGLDGDGSNYRYNYKVYLSGGSDSLKVGEIRLNEYFCTDN